MFFIIYVYIYTMNGMLYAVTLECVYVRVYTHSADVRICSEVILHSIKYKRHYGQTAGPGAINQIL